MWHNLGVVQEVQLTQVQSLSQEDALEEDMAAYSSILARKILWSEELLRLQLWGCKELDATECACTRACTHTNTHIDIILCSHCQSKVNFAISLSCCHFFFLN